MSAQETVAMTATLRRPSRRAGRTFIATLFLGAALAAPTAVLANDLHQSPPISWDDAGFQGSAGDCDGVDLKPGQVLWHFVHTKTDAGDLPASIDAQFGTGPVADGGQVHGGSIVMYELVTDQTTLEGASDSIHNDGLLNLSHICSAADEASESVPVETESVPVETESVPVETPVGSVEAETGTPHEGLTPPPTDTLADGTQTSDPTTALLLIAAIALGAGLSVDRARAKARR
jgi:hypothetical protein